ncbi:hypothetical protein EMIHUDRAFT_465372 [Emiliania huxleyi CCMP1516]|uniref:TIR domain-containing protein n=2 Tax=Emiliania huxleyi TaxID=2903 RepID=A0A0D3IEX1_EMIH1|nr:hypothetical protein EMIHUDRAFT_465372 [Emiliania huxleyi CCMP1516]EOD09806.1 hypothetical protein EMIHUDRAFT_465372 [Emiliania huxleyi CCMP1516]|eukprot:XP_005762235.1 hypothetical protein EMIHUDRAFT_465372 [Emiliania huxleyi CCMP1516]
MTVLIGAALVIFLVGAVVAARRVAKVPTIRLVTTKQAPELMLGKGMTWHLFNSHIWSTGQDAVAVIKNELQQLLPGIKVFLDVDDLEDIGALESYIGRSQVILFFLSKGYFRSKNCLREIRSSLEKGKPIILVQEADPAKGGGSIEASSYRRGSTPAPPQARSSRQPRRLQELRAECPAELQPAVFDQLFPLVVWMRIEEFQLVSLKMISEAREAVIAPTPAGKHQTPLFAQALLVQTPTYAGLRSLPLTIPGEVVLWASPANQGARRMANELAASFPGVAVDNAAEMPERATHMLLYLCEESWSDDRLAEQVKQELIAAGLYRDLAIACFSGLHRQARPALGIHSHSHSSRALQSRSMSSRAITLGHDRTVIAEVVGTGCSDELAEYVAREARREYTEASQIFELVVASVAYDNSGVTHVVNGLVDRAVAFVRAIATREHEDSGGDPEALAAAVDAFVLKTFSTSDYAGGFAAFGSDPDAVRDLLADKTEDRLREKVGELCLEALLAGSLAAAAIDAKEEGWGVAGGEEEALARFLGIDFTFYCERRALTPNVDGLWGTHTLAALDMGLSVAEFSFTSRLRAAAPAAAADADAMPWFSGDAAGLPLRASTAAGLPLRASSSGTTFQILTIARYLGVPAEEMPLLRLAAVAFLCPQHHSFLEVMLGASEYCGAGPLAAGAACWRHLLPRDYCFQLPGGGAVTRDSLNAEIEAEMRGVGDIKDFRMNKTVGNYAFAFDKYRSAWPAQRLSVDNLGKIAARFRSLVAFPGASPAPPEAERREVDERAQQQQQQQQQALHDSALRIQAGFRASREQKAALRAGMKKRCPGPKSGRKSGAQRTSWGSSAIDRIPTDSHTNTNSRPSAAAGGRAGGRRPSERASEREYEP